MQAAIHSLPLHPLPQPARLSLNGINAILNPIPMSIPTPPVTTRKRKRPHQYTVSYSEVQEVDSHGRLREVIVIEDTPPPTASPATTHHNGYSASYQPPIYSAPIRTRARAAAEAQALSASSSTAIPAPAPKRRRKDVVADEIRAAATKKLAKAPPPSSTLPTTKSWASGSAAATHGVRILSLSLTYP